jgi:hypothetical protein
VEDRADAGYGAIYLWNYEYHYVDYSFPYIRTGITCVAPRPDPLAGWLTPLLPFTLTSWAAVSVSVVVSTFSLFLVTKATEKFPSKYSPWPAQSSFTGCDICFWSVVLSTKSEKLVFSSFSFVIYFVFTCVFTGIFHVRLFLFLQMFGFR